MSHALETKGGHGECRICGHPFAPHAVIATTGDPHDGGIILCPEGECDCIATWGVNGAQPKAIPDAAEIGRMWLAMNPAARGRT